MAPRLPRRRTPGDRGPFRVTTHPEQASAPMTVPTRPRALPVSLWLRHPALAHHATFLARRGGEDHGELAHESHALAKANRLVHRRSRRIGRLCAGAHAAAVRATDLCTDALLAPDRLRGGKGKVTATHGWAVTARDARPLLAETMDRIDEEVEAGITTHLQSRGRLMTAIAYLLLAVDAIALFMVFGLLLNIDWTAPTPVPLVTATAFALFGAGVQAKLAMELGKRLWAWRVSDSVEEFPPRSAVITCSVLLLLVVSVFAALSIYLRVRHEGELVDEVGVATVIGLALAACALAAPWIIVQQEAFDGSALTRRATTLTRVLVDTAHTQTRSLRRADRALSRAHTLDARARRCHARLRSRIGRCYIPTHRAILLSRQLSAAPVPSVTPNTDSPRSALPIRLSVDETAITVALSQSEQAIAQARSRRLALTADLSPSSERIPAPR
ncbi:hypothetical protein [Actinokineospora enzanensis]|uniref:hypothetical protein n=1 Tax=Actinokineospora enzanensis TaxID=155975 RepID=UPI0003806158|nr:hypothetical protein [Actinokineospora enzanensis]